MCLYEQIFFVQDSWALGRLLIMFDPSTLTDTSAAQAQRPPKTQTLLWLQTAV